MLLFICCYDCIVLTIMDARSHVLFDSNQSHTRSRRSTYQESRSSFDLLGVGFPSRGHTAFISTTDVMTYPATVIKSCQTTVSNLHRKGDAVKSLVGFKLFSWKSNVSTKPSRTGWCLEVSELQEVCHFKHISVVKEKMQRSFYCTIHYFWFYIIIFTKRPAMTRASVLTWGIW